MTGLAEDRQGSVPWKLSRSPLMLEAGLELVILAAIGAAIIGLGLLPLTWRGGAIAVIGYMVVALLVGAGLNRHAPHRHFGLANSITLSRAGFGVLLLALVAEEALGGVHVLNAGFRSALTVAAVAALALDGVDGWVARRSNMASEFGSRFDVESDGIFLLALALILTVGGIVGPWVLASGLIYYIFRLAGLVWPVLAAPLFPSMRRKTICVAQGALMIAAIVPAMPQWGAELCCLTGIALLLYSFGVDIAWLIARAPRAEAYSQPSELTNV